MPRLNARIFTTEFPTASTWLKIGRAKRPLSATPHQARCGQMGAEFSDYIIERSLRRDSRPIGLGFSGKGRRRRVFSRYNGRYPAASRWPGKCASREISRGYKYAPPGTSRRDIPARNSPVDFYGDAFPGYAPPPWNSRCISRGAPGILDAQPDHFPGKSPDTPTSSWMPGFHGKSPWNPPGNG